MSVKPKCPSGLSAAGRALWRQILADFDLSGHELRLLEEACLTVDLLVRLETAVSAGPPVVEGPQGPKINPAVVEVRQQRLVLARLFASLRIPIDDNTGRTQARPVRGVYSIKGGASA